MAITRLDHSIKNIFVVPGIVAALSFSHDGVGGGLLRRVSLGVIATTLIACSNYVINEILDAPFDRLHPYKRLRPAASGRICIPIAYVQWVIMMVVGLSIGAWISRPFAITAAGLWVMGCVYNIPPLRSKDVPYLDVLVESINNPLRMLLGWYMVTSIIVPPASLLCCYWMLGSYFMALKRVAEYREINDSAVAKGYRLSFRHYTERKLLESIVFYASCAMLMLGAFIMRYRIELILAFPFVSLMMSTYFDLSFKEHSAVQNPEKLYREPRLMSELIVTCLVATLLLFVRLPWLVTLFAPSVK